MNRETNEPNKAGEPKEISEPKSQLWWPKNVTDQT